MWLGHLVTVLTTWALVAGARGPPRTAEGGPPRPAEGRPPRPAPGALNKALTALEAATTFFEKNYDRIILDGVFGLRVAEGQLMSTLSTLSRHDQDLSQAMREVAARVQHLQERMNQAARAAVPYLLAENANYFTVFQDTVTRPYIVSYNPRYIREPGNKKAAPPVDKYGEKRGDACFADLVGRSLARGILFGRKCTVRDACYQMMTSQDKSGYALTHQLLFFIQAQHIGCHNRLVQLFGSTNRLSAFEQRECDVIYEEASRLALGGHVVTTHQDLFLEQGTVCGMIGFEDFLRSDWLDMIISWQSPSGCFTDDDDSFRPPHNRGRHLSYEMELEGGCLSHKSGLGTALLGVYVRYLAEHAGQFEDLPYAT